MDNEQQFPSVYPVSDEDDANMVTHHHMNARCYGLGKEAAATRAELKDFDYRDSMAMALVLRVFGYKLRFNELKGVVMALGDFLARKGVMLPALTRNAKRSLPLLLKYINDNIAIFTRWLPAVTLVDADKIPIIPHRKSVSYARAGRH